MVTAYPAFNTYPGSNGNAPSRRATEIQRQLSRSKE